MNVSAEALQRRGGDEGEKTVSEDLKQSLAEYQKLSKARDDAMAALLDSENNLQGNGNRGSDDTNMVVDEAYRVYRIAEQAVDNFLSEHLDVSELIAQYLALLSDLKYAQVKLEQYIGEDRLHSVFDQGEPDAVAAERVDLRAHLHQCEARFNDFLERYPELAPENNQ